jgi:outer membrane immunogenic protein
MKKFIIIISILTCSNFLIAQNPIEIGQAQINAGFGFSNYGLPVYVGFDYGIHEDITVGAEFSFRSYNDEYFGSKYSHKMYGFSGNANYHFNNLLGIEPTYDVYGGLNVGFYSWSSPSGYLGKRTSGLGLGLQIGGRYYFNDKIGVNLELGGGNATSGGKIGISIKL